MKNLTKQDIEMVMRLRIKALKMQQSCKDQKLRNHAHREIQAIVQQLGENAPD